MVISKWMDQIGTTTTFQGSAKDGTVCRSTFVFDQANCSALRYWPPQTGAPYYVVDLLQEMDAPGEFWLDRASGELFIFPPVRNLD